MMDSYLTATAGFKERQSLSCNNLAAIQSGCNDKRLRKHAKDTSSLTRPRFLSHGHSPETSARSMNRSRSKSSSELVDAVDSQLAEIRGNLTMLRRQDTDFHKRMYSLTNSIGELTSRSSLPPSGETSDGMPSHTDDANGKDKSCTEDDRIIKNNTKIISKSFSSEVFKSIPVIMVTSDSYKRRPSSTRSLRRYDPSLHESAKPLNLSTGSKRRGTCLTDYTYLYGSGEEVSTLL